VQRQLSQASWIINAGPAVGTAAGSLGAVLAKHGTPQAKPITEIFWGYLQQVLTRNFTALNDSIVVCYLLLRQHLISLLRAREMEEPEKAVYGRMIQQYRARYPMVLGYRHTYMPTYLCVSCSISKKKCRYPVARRVGLEPLLNIGYDIDVVFFDIEVLTSI
jgi:hypothetical protein